MTLKPRWVKIAKGYITNKFKVNPDLAKKIKDWNNADFQLYDHFNKTFWRRVDAFGRERMEAELESFRAEQKKAEELCIESYQVRKPASTVN